jgi:hypothetical protein
MTSRPRPPADQASADQVMAVELLVHPLPKGRPHGNQCTCLRCWEYISSSQKQQQSFSSSTSSSFSTSTTSQARPKKRQRHQTATASSSSASSSSSSSTEQTNIDKPFNHLFDRAREEARRSKVFSSIHTAKEIARVINPKTKTFDYLKQEQDTNDRVLSTLLVLFRRLQATQTSEEENKVLQEWPSSEFHKQSLTIIPQDQNDFAPCFYVFPEDPKLEASKIQWPESVEELDKSEAWPSRVLPPNRPTSQVEPTNPPRETIESSKHVNLNPNTFEVHRFQYTASGDFVTHSEFASSPVGIGHNKTSDDGTPLGGVMLGTRVKAVGYLHGVCNELMVARKLRDVCPASHWKFGPVGGTRCGASDPRHYLITGWHHGLTRTHIDSGVQVVLYNVVAGKNRFIGIPREIAIRLSALQRATFKFSAHAQVVAADRPDLLTKILKQGLQYELKVLNYLLDRNMLEYAEAVGGEALMILPVAGHAVLTESYKIVLASEMHWWNEEKDK